MNKLYTIRKLIYGIIFDIFTEIKFLSKYGVKYRKIVKYLHIAGWLTEKEAIVLYDLTSRVTKSTPKVVEIGSWVGKSSFIIARGLKQHCRDSNLYCIDPFNAAGDDYSRKIYKNFVSTWKKTQKLSLQQIFMQNMANCGVLDIIKVLVGYSFNFAKKFNQKIDFLFIDGNHDYKAVLRDFQDWSKYIKKGGIIAFHDVDFDPYGKLTGKEDNIGPGLVVKRYIINNKNWTDFHRIDGLFYATKK